MKSFALTLVAGDIVLTSDEKLMSHNLRMEWNVTHAIILMNSSMTGH